MVDVDDVGWVYVVVCIALEWYVTAAAIIMQGVGVIPDGWAWYVLFAEVVGKLSHTRRAKAADVEELSERVKKLEARRAEVL